MMSTYLTEDAALHFSVKPLELPVSSQVNRCAISDTADDSCLQHVVTARALPDNLDQCSTDNSFNLSSGCASIHESV